MQSTTVFFFTSCNPFRFIIFICRKTISLYGFNLKLTHSRVDEILHRGPGLRVQDGSSHGDDADAQFQEHGAAQHAQVHEKVHPQQVGAFFRAPKRLVGQKNDDHHRPAKQSAQRKLEQIHTIVIISKFLHKK
jgi:hypothetical protein